MQKSKKNYVVSTVAILFVILIYSLFIQTSTISKEQAKNIAENRLNKIKTQTEFSDFEEMWVNPDAVIGTPYLLKSVDSKPLYWKVPVNLNEKIIGFINVGMKGDIIQYGSECYARKTGCNSELDGCPSILSMANCPSVVTYITIEEAKELAKNITSNYGNAIISEPSYVYTDMECCNGEAWMITIEKDGRPASRIFISGHSAFEIKF